MDIKAQAKQKQAMREEERGAGTGALKTNTRHVSAARLSRKAPGQVTVASTSLQTMLMAMNQWHIR